MNENVHRIDNFYREFLDRFLHGLKNRLTPATTAAHMMAEPSPNRTPETLESLGETVASSLDGARDLMMGVQRILSVRPVGAQDRNLLEFFIERASGMKVECEVDAPDETVPLDPALWGVIVDEILSNAKQHADGRADIRVVRQNGALSLVCRAEGGALQMLPERALEATRKRDGYDGHGIGLSCVALAVALLGGSLNFEAHEGEVLVSVRAPLACDPSARGEVSYS